MIRSTIRISHSTKYQLPITVAIVASACAPSVPAPSSVSGADWYRGNLHTHSLWSDGDDYPEMVVRWYRENGYDFLAISDHNTIMEGEKWVVVPDSGDGLRAFEEYARTFGEDWVETREEAGKLQVRLKPFETFSPVLSEPGEFLLIRSEEISDGYGGKPVHVNATNPAEYIPPQGGNSVLEVMQNNVDAVLAQRERTGRPMFPHLNHPNFVYAVTPEDMIALEGERFFEVYNGHPLVNNHGDHEHPSTEALWDLVLAHRLTDGRDVLYGLATDDAHNYHELQDNRANPGQGWVMVRAEELTTGAIVAALERGDFYASTGVSLREVAFDGETLRLTVEPEPGVTYETDFIGTRTAAFSTDASATGTVFASMQGTDVSYRLTGDELYVRARVRSSRRKVGGQAPDEREMAWTQPVVPAR